MILKMLLHYSIIFIFASTALSQSNSSTLQVNSSSSSNASNSPSGTSTLLLVSASVPKPNTVVAKTLSSSISQSSFAVTSDKTTNHSLATSPVQLSTSTTNAVKNMLNSTLFVNSSTSSTSFLLTTSTGDAAVGNNSILNTATINSISSTTAINSISSTATINSTLSTATAFTTTNKIPKMTESISTPKPSMVSASCSASTKATVVPSRGCAGVSNYCQNGGFCRNDTKSSIAKCYCNNDYFGKKCQFKASDDSQDKVDPLYKQLTYAFAGTTGFLFLVIVFMICCRRRQQSEAGLDYIKELDNFDIGNKRASAIITNPNALKTVDMYSNGGKEEF